METHHHSAAIEPLPRGGEKRMFTRLEACAFFGVALRTWSEWERVGRVPPSEWGVAPRGQRCRVYSRSALSEIKAAWERATEPSIDPDRPSVARVPVVSEKHPGMIALIDASDLPQVQGKRWNWTPGKRDGAGSVVVSMNGTPKPSLARILLGITDAEQLVSHRNGDRLDHRRENLVVRTRGQVSRARMKTTTRKGIACASRFKGVTRTDSGRKWSATVHIEGAYRNLGRFHSEIDAALAYDAAVREAFGDEAKINLPDADEVARLRALEPVVEQDTTWPPAGMMERAEACAMFGVSLSAWMAWERKGRITCGEFHPLPNDRPGRCKLYPRDALERARVEIEQLGKPYADPAQPGVWRVPLKSYLANREVLIDEADLPIVAGRNWNWSARSDGRVAGTVVLAAIKNQVPLARLIAGATDLRQRVSHLNGDALDCRRANLATLTFAEVSAGCGKSATRAGRACTSAYKGVTFDATRGQWVAQVRKGGVGRQLGRFDDESQAAMAYDAAARVLFGNHGRVNFPDRPSDERALADARRAMGEAVDANRAARRRQRDLERALRATAATTRVGDGDAEPVMIETARQWFDVTINAWRRWQRFGWVPGGETIAFDAVADLLARCGLDVLPRADPQRQGAWRVPLSGEAGEGRFALVDADVVPRVRGRRWRFAPSPVGRGGEVQTMNPTENVRLHYVVLGIEADPLTFVIGFRNDDPLDCRRENLVERTLSDSGGNKRKQATWCGRPCTSRFKGVSWDARRERWAAAIKKDRRSQHLGTYSDELAAAQAYDAAAHESYGEHARVNFPDGVDAWLEKDATPVKRAAA